MTWLWVCLAALVGGIVGAYAMAYYIGKGLRG